MTKPIPPTIPTPIRLILIKSAVSSQSGRSEEHTSELQSQSNLVCRLLLEKKKIEDDIGAVSRQLVGQDVQASELYPRGERYYHASLPGGTVTTHSHLADNASAFDVQVLSP